MSDPKPLAIVAGAGPGLGEALLRRFQTGGYDVLGLARRNRQMADDISILSVDLTSTESIAKRLQDVIGSYGAPAVVIHNPAKLVISPFEETGSSSFEETWRAMALSAVLLAQETLPAMVESGGGALLVSGATASLRGGSNFSAFASAKFALRGLTQSLAREYQGKGIHVAHVILDGIIDTTASRALHKIDPGRMMNTEDIAEAFWQLAHQPNSAWTHELDLRPMGEKF